jgi:hypothetical protein
MATAPAGTTAAGGPAMVPAGAQVSLVDILDRVLARGVVVSGEITLSVADVDLVQISLRALLCSVRRAPSGPARPSTADGAP